MQQGSLSRAGGCFLTIFILAGFAWGLAIRDPVKGTMIGTVVGAILALIVWQVDKRRNG